jgi:hypothetical protein
VSIPGNKSVSFLYEMATGSKTALDANKIFTSSIINCNIESFMLLTVADDGSVSPYTGTKVSIDS